MAKCADLNSQYGGYVNVKEFKENDLEIILITEVIIIN